MIGELLFKVRNYITERQYKALFVSSEIVLTVKSVEQLKILNEEYFRLEDKVSNWRDTLRTMVTNISIDTTLQPIFREFYDLEFNKNDINEEKKQISQFSDYIKLIVAMRKETKIDFLKVLKLRRNKNGSAFRAVIDFYYNLYIEREIKFDLEKGYIESLNIILHR